MATIFAVSPNLRLKRSSQSGNRTMTVAWQTVYQQTELFAFMFASGRFDLTNMVAGDHIEIQYHTRHENNGDWIIEDLFDYDDAQPTNKQKVSLGAIIDTFGVRIQMRQTVGVLKDVFVDLYDATR